MQKITPHLWFDRQAKEAAEFYVSLFPGSRIRRVTALHDTPSGDCDLVSFELGGLPFMAISAGPVFKFNPSVSFHILCRTREEVEAKWEKLSAGGKILMPLGDYPFSERFGWTEDRYGLSWQVSCAGGSEIRQPIIPSLLFVGQVCGKAEEALNFYASVFKDPPPRILSRYGKGEEPDREGATRYARVALRGQEFAAQDSAHPHAFAFNEAISFLLPCDTQQEIDYYWQKLSARPEAEQCGWLKDPYGLSWQVVPAILGEMMASPDPQRVARVTQAFLKMKKFDIPALRQAYDGE